MRKLFGFLILFSSLTILTACGNAGGGSMGVPVAASGEGATAGITGTPVSAKDLKVYVMVGFHVDLYHSWRGDTPDEAGYGFDHRIISSSIRKLNAANAQGKKAKAYWDFAANNWTFGEFLPKSFPELIKAWKTRDNNDEFVIGPFNNGLNSAATKKEFTKAIEFTLKNPGGYGLKQMFKNVGMIYRPQEMFFSSGQVNWLHEAGVHALILQYASYAFNAFANFIQPLDPADRFNPLWFKSHETDEPILMLPSISPVDLLNFTSLEALMIDLRRQQMEGKIDRNVVIHLNIDADAVSWEPMIANQTAQKLVPNTGGLQEMINAVNKYQWSDFTTPTEYLKLEQPRKTILVKQDMADGAFDGMASWAEKETTQSQWTKIEQSRAVERLLNAKMPGFESRDAWMDAGFFNRLLSLATTHFGMSVPFVHYQRQARLEGYTAASLKARLNEFWSWSKTVPLMQMPKDKSEVLLSEYPRYGQSGFVPAHAIERQRIVIPKNSTLVPKGFPFVRRSLSRSEDILDIYRADIAQETTHIPLLEDGAESARAKCQPVDPSSFNDGIASGDMKVLFSKTSGIQSLESDGQVFGDTSFLSPFISFKQKIAMSKANTTAAKATILRPDVYQVTSQNCATAPSIREVSLSTEIDLQTENRMYPVKVDYRVWRDVGHPYLFMDVHSDLPYTIDESVPTEADRRYMQHVDWRWEEIALSQLKPSLGNSKLLKVWKMNYEGLISDYEVSQGEINPKNKNLATMNNHVTPGWVAISDGHRGFLVAFNALKRSSFGAVPMRIHTDDDGNKTAALNPFGTYFGQQPDYSHVGGERLGTLLANMGASYIKPNAPGFVGKTIDYELMIAPYRGDRPPAELIRDALSFAYQAIGVISMPSESVLEDSFSHADRLNASASREGMGLTSATVVAPSGFAAASMNGSINTSWTTRSEQQIDGYQLIWREQDAPEWQTRSVRPETTSSLISGLKNGTRYEVNVRAFRKDQASALSAPQFVRPDEKLTSMTVNKIAPNLKLLYLALDMIVDQHLLKNPDPNKSPLKNPESK